MNGCLCLIVVLLLQFATIVVVHHRPEQQLSMSMVHGAKDLIDKGDIDFRRPKYIKIEKLRFFSINIDDVIYLHYRL